MQNCPDNTTPTRFGLLISFFVSICIVLCRNGCFKPECDEYIRIFEYSNILGTNIYSDIHSGQFCLYEYIRTFVRVKFVCTNIFRHSFMSVLESENRPNIRIYSNIRTIFNTNIYSDIRSCQIFYTNIFGHSFV